MTTYAELKVKTWKLEQEQREACNRVGGFDYSRRNDTDRRPIEEDGCEFVVAEIVKETEKAMYVCIDMVWSCWLPKSTVEIVKLDEVA